MENFLNQRALVFYSGDTSMCQVLGTSLIECCVHTVFLTSTISLRYCRDPIQSHIELVAGFEGLSH